MTIVLGAKYKPGYVQHNDRRTGEFWETGRDASHMSADELRLQKGLLKDDPRMRVDDPDQFGDAEQVPE